MNLKLRYNNIKTNRIALIVSLLFYKSSRNNSIKKFLDFYLYNALLTDLIRTVN